MKLDVKKLFVLTCLLYTFNSFAQVNDTVPDMIDGCLDKGVDSLIITFSNDSIYISGSVEANCAGPWSLVRYFNQDTISLIATDDCLANCTCQIMFATSFFDNGYNQYNLNIGYSCSSEPTTFFYLDTTITRYITHDIEIANNSQIKLYPNPTKKEAFIEIEDNRLITEVVIRNILSQVCYHPSFTYKEHGILVDLMNLPEGIYILELRDEDISHFIKLIKH